MPQSQVSKHAMSAKNLARPDETRHFEKGHVEVVTLAGVTFGRATFQPGWKWSTCSKPVAKTPTCEAAHLGYQLSGRMHIVMDNGAETEFGPGDICSIPPGHDGWVVGNEPVVFLDITGMSEYAKLK